MKYPGYVSCIKKKYFMKITQLEKFYMTSANKFKTL